MYRFLLSPKWFLSHLFVAALVVTFVVLGIWQLDRLGERQDRNDQITSQRDLPVANLADVVGLDQQDDLEKLRFRQVEITGEFVVDDEVDVRNRSRDGSPGLWVLTPLQLADGTAVAVNRGWVPLALSGGHSRPEAEPASGQVTVSGWIELTVEAEGLQTPDPEGGVLDDLARPDLERFEEQLDYELYPVYITLQQPAPSTGAFPVPVPELVLDEGPHFSYAVQWFLFASIGLAGYLLVLRRLARDKAGLIDKSPRGLIPVSVPRPDQPVRDKKVLK